MPSGHYPRDQQPPRSRSGLKGVISFPRHASKPWKVYGRHHGQYVCIGYFATKEEAAAAYDRWALQKYGPETYLNNSRPGPQQDPAALLRCGLEVLRQMRQSSGDSLSP